MHFLIALFSSSWIGPLVTALIMIVSGIYINRRAKTEAEKVAKEAYEGAIAAMKAHIDALQDRIKDTEEESKHVQRTLDTILEALKTKGIYITIQGQLVTIREGKETTITRIHKDNESA